MRPNRTVESAAGSEARTEEIPVVGAVPRRRSVLAMLSGILAGALVVLALAIVVAQVVSTAHGQDGPGVVAVVGHVAGAVLAVLAQRRVDRSTGRRRLLAAWGVVALFVLVLGVFWWAWLWLFWSF